jgi:signal transduction histidine kinase
MPIRLRLAVAFAVIAAALYALGGWLFARGISLSGGESRDVYEATLSQVARELAVGGVVFVAVAALGAYWLARAALSPVERMRRQVAAVSGRDEESAVQVPGTRDEIAALAGTMNELLGRLQGALAKQRAFVADASHELRTPLAVLRGELELAARPGRSRQELAAAVRSAAGEAERLSRLTDDLLLLARSDEDQLSLRPGTADIGRLLARTADGAASRLAATGVSCHVEARNGILATIDGDRIRQAVDNLVDNALRFAPRGSAIMLSATAYGSDLGIEVRDDGPGFAPGFLPHAFERFRRPDTGRSRDNGGAGLGLAIVRAIAAAHGGTTTAANRPGGGAVVCLRLPGAIELPAQPPTGPVTVTREP